MVKQASRSGSRTATLPSGGYIDFRVAENQEFDLVIVCSSTSSHARDTQVFQHCSRILVEKPIFASTVDGVGWIEELADKVWVSSPLRQMSSFAFFRAKMRERDYLKASLQCFSDLTHWRPGRNPNEGYWGDRTQGGVMRELIHEFDYALLLFGTLSVVEASLSRSEKYSFEAHSQAQLRMLSTAGQEIELRLDWASELHERTCRLFADGSSLVWDIFHDRVITETEHSVVIEFAGPNSRDELFEAQVLQCLANNRAKGERVSTVNEAIQALNLVEEAERLDQR